MNSGKVRWIVDVLLFFFPVKFRCEGRGFFLRGRMQADGQSRMSQNSERQCGVFDSLSDNCRPVDFLSQTQARIWLGVWPGFGLIIFHRHVIIRRLFQRDTGWYPFWTLVHKSATTAWCTVIRAYTGTSLDAPGWNSTNLDNPVSLTQWKKEKIQE